MDCSIIICTRNRAECLRNTLRTFESVTVPDGWQVEMIIADNGSSDDTVEVIEKAVHESIGIRNLPVPVSGKSRAQNAAVMAARSDVLLFTDDDVVPARDWIRRMAEPLIGRRCMAVAGRILLGEELERPWLTPMHRRWLAEVNQPAAESPELVGANMGIHRSVFDTISLFDEELGPGVTGFGEETLLWLQMKEAGMRILPVTETHVTHHPDPSRLDRSNWLAAATNHGKTHAYLFHHWKHETLSRPLLTSRWTRLKHRLRRIAGGTPPLSSEGCPEWELCYLTRASTLEEFARQSRIPRKYPPRGLRKNQTAGVAGA